MHGAVHVLSVFSLTNPRQLTAEYFSLSLSASIHFVSHFLPNFVQF